MSVENFERDPRIRDFWATQMEKIKAITPTEYRELTKRGELPLARIKKIMKIEDQVKTQMISGEGPILIGKAAEFLIEELTLRAWLHADSHKRKTLQKADISNATAQSEMFDFLLDIVPKPGQSGTNLPIKPRPDGVPVTTTCTAVENGSIIANEAGILTSDGQPVQIILPDGFEIQNGDGTLPYVICDASGEDGVMQVAMGENIFDVTEIGPPQAIEGNVQLLSTVTSSHS